MSAHWRPGDVVVYRKQKNSLHPGPRAKDVFPAPYGDFYSYTVDKFWRVVAVLPDDKLIVCSRRGKQHTIAAADPALRRPRWWERWFLRRRFPPPIAVTPPTPLELPHDPAPDAREKHP